jgi:hypothetical protein
MCFRLFVIHLSFKNILYAKHFNFYHVCNLNQVTTLGEDGDDDNDGNGSAEELADLMDELSAEVNSTEILSGEEGGGDDDAEDPIELVHVDEDFFYMAHIMRLMAALHTLVSLAMLIAYYHLKVSLELYPSISRIVIYNVLH